MLNLWDEMSKSAQPQGRFHNPKVGGSIPPPATISSIDSKTYVDNFLGQALLI